MRSRSCLIVGSGMAGLSAALELRRHGWQTLLLDKGRRPGGRMATRERPPSRFDHGAQFFTVRDPRFRTQVDHWLAYGWARPWFTENGHTRYCGTHGMSLLAEAIGGHLNIRQATSVRAVMPGPQGWRIATYSGDEFTADAVLLTAPAPQSVALLPNGLLPAEGRARLLTITYAPCVALMATFSSPTQLPHSGFLSLDSGPLAILADNTQKGVSTHASDLTLHSTPEFARSACHRPDDEVAADLLRAAQAYLAAPPLAYDLHRWRYAKTEHAFGASHLLLHLPAPLAFAGDGFGNAQFSAGRIESAFLSGLEAAQAIANST